MSYSTLKLLEDEFQAAWAMRDLEKCIHLLGRILEINPRSADAHLQLGKIYGMLYAYDDAIIWFDKAVEVSPKEQCAVVLIEAGRAAKDFYDPTISESFFNKAIEVAVASGGEYAMADTAESKIALAEHSMRIRKHEVAKFLVEEVLGVCPKDESALLLWCQLNEGLFDRCVERLGQIMKSDEEHLKVKAAYQLAKVLDKAGDYDGAMRALHLAKSSMMQARDPIVLHRRKIRDEIKELAKGFTNSKRSEWKTASLDFGDPKKLALLGGHPRSGTTLLEQVLDSHPGVVSAEESENLNIFAFAPLMRKYFPLKKIHEIMNACSTEDLKWAREQYFNAMGCCLQQPVGFRLLVDKNPSLTILAPELFRFFPEIKFVTMIRDPRDVVVSCFMQSFFPPDAISGNFLTLEDTAAEVGAFMDIWSDVSERLGEIVCEVRYEDMVEDLEGNARKVLDFLNLDWNDSVMDYDRHALEKVVRSPTADAVTEKVHTRAKNRWKNYEKHLEPVFETLKPCLKAFCYD